MIGEESLHSYFLESEIDKPIDLPFHKKLLEKFKMFQILGGMPAVLNSYVGKQDILESQAILDEMITSFIDDFAKYKKRSPVVKLRETFEAISH